MNPLVKAVELIKQWHKLYCDCTGGNSDEFWKVYYESREMKPIRDALSLYSQSMNTEDHARGYYMNDDGQSKPEPVVQDNEMWHPNYYPASKEGASGNTTPSENEGKQAERVNNAFDKLVGENYTLRSLIKTSFFYCNQQLNSEWVKFQNEMGLSDESKKEIVSLNKIHAECPHCKSLFDIDPPSGTFIHPSPPVPPIESGERGEVERLKGE